MQAGWLSVVTDYLCVLLLRLCMCIPFESTTLTPLLVGHFKSTSQWLQQRQFGSV